MKLNIVFLKSTKRFAEKEKRQIKNIVKNATHRAAKLLNLGNNRIINFTVYRFRKNYIGAFTQAEDLIHISIPRKKKLNEKELKSVIYHEIHHIKRGYFGYSKKKIFLLEALFSEGLATVFALEKVPEYIPKWSKYTKKFIEKWLLDVKKEKFKTNYSHDEWFFGARGKPYQLGYKIGTYLVRQIRSNYPKIKLEKLVKKTVPKLLKLSKVNL